MGEVWTDGWSVSSRPRKRASSSSSRLGTWFVKWKMDVASAPCSSAASDHGSDGRILRVGVGLVAQEHVKIMQTAGGEQQRLVQVVILQPRFETEGFGAVE